MSKLKILGGTAVREAPYPAWPVHDERDVDAVTRVIESGRWGGYAYPGPESEKFAEGFAKMQGGEDAVLMVNGTVTMEVALRALNIGWGDEVIVPAYTFQATATAPMAAGAIPVIVDVDPETYCIDPALIDEAITERTKAILPVHLGAQMADMDAITDIAERHDLAIVEDCAHAHGAKWRDKGAGTFGEFGSFSFQSSKILTTGEGGALICRTPELASRAASIVDCGRAHSKRRPHAELGMGDDEKKVFTLGANYRMAELQAALGNVALQRFPDQVKHRMEMLEYLEERLPEVPGVRMLKRDPRHTTRSFYRYVFAADPEVFGAEHDVVCGLLHTEGIPCWIGYEAMHNYTLFQPHLARTPVPSVYPEYFDFAEMDFPVATRACEHEAVWLDEKVFRAGREGIDDVITALKKIQENAEKMDEVKRVAMEKFGWTSH
jgi:dTDP-4-amino-4,6-dideoxygalactose transaminase